MTRNELMAVLWLELGALVIFVVLGSQGCATAMPAQHFRANEPTAFELAGDEADVTWFVLEERNARGVVTETVLRCEVEEGGSPVCRRAHVQ